MSPGESKHSRNSNRKAPRTRKPSFERLEDRALLTVVFNLHYGAETDVSMTNNGQGLQNPTVNLIFAGNWAPYVANEQSIVNAIQSIVSGPYLTGLTQYSTSGTATMGAVGFNTTQFIPTLVNNNTNNAELQAYVQQSISSFGSPSPPSVDAEHAPIYIVIVNPADWAASTAGTVYAGFNIPGTYNSTPIHMILTSTTADGSNNISIDNLTTTVSHELAERSVNNAQLFHVSSSEAAASNGVYTTSSNNQVADGEMDNSGGPYCYRLGAYLVQAYWSDLDNAAIVPNVNYNSSAADYALYPTFSGSSWARKYDLAITPFGVSVAFRSFQGSNPAELKFNVTFNGQTATFGAATDPLNSVHVQGPISVKVDDSNRSTPSSLTIGDAFESPFLGGVGGFFPGAYIDIDFSQASTAALEVDTSRLNGSTVDIRRTIIDGTVTVDAAVGDTAINVNYVAPGGPLIVNLGDGTQTVNISPTTKDYSSSIFGDVSVSPGVGLGTLNVDDYNDAAARHWTIDAGSISSDINGAGVIHIGRLFSVTLNGGRDDNTFTVLTTFNGLTTSIWTQGFGDSVNVLGTGFLSTLNVIGYARTINFGDAGRTASIRGLVNVDVTQGALSVDDSADLLGQNDVVVSSSSIIGLSDGIIGFESSGVTALSILGSHGGSTYHFLGTPNYSSYSPTTTTLTCEGTDSVNVGDHGSLADIQGDLLIGDPASFVDLTIDASADAATTNHATISNSAVTGLSAGAIRFDQSAVSALNVTGGHGGTTYDVLSLPMFFLIPITTTINALAGDTINLGQNGSLQGAWGNGSLVGNFSGTGAAAHVVMDGSLDSAAAAYTIGGNNNLTVVNATVGAGVTINGFRSQDEVRIDLQAGTVNADLTHTSPGTISVDGTVRLKGTNPAAQVNLAVHARARATVSPVAANESVVEAFNSLYLLGTRPQDSLGVFDGNNQLSISNQPIQSPYVQFAATQSDPSTVAAGDPFDFAVVAQDAQGGTLANYAGQVQWYAYNRTTGHYSESDYESFAAGDHGQHVFHGIVLPEAGTYSLGFDDGWNASSVTITVLAGGGGHLDGQAGDAEATPSIAVASAAAQPDAGANEAPAAASSIVAPATAASATIPATVAGSVNASAGGGALKNSSAGDTASPVEVTAPRQEQLANRPAIWALPDAKRVCGTGSLSESRQPAPLSRRASGPGERSLILSTSIQVAALDRWFERLGRGMSDRLPPPATTEKLDFWDSLDVMASHFGENSPSPLRRNAR